MARARTGAPHQSGSERARYASPAQNRRRPGFPVEGGRARASLGAALGAGRPWSDLVTNHVVRTVSKVLCLRSLRTSRCCWALPVAVAASHNHTRLQLLLQHLRARRSSGALASQSFLSPRILRCFRRNSAPLYCVCARVGHTPPVRQRCGVPVAKETTTAAHDSFCAHVPDRIFGLGC